MGYFSIGPARTVETRGTIFSVDRQHEMLGVLLRRAGKAGVADRSALRTRPTGLSAPR
jgi:hypothetical protein